MAWHFGQKWHPWIFKGGPDRGHPATAQDKWILTLLGLLFALPFGLYEGGLLSHVSYFLIFGTSFVPHWVWDVSHQILSNRKETWDKARAINAVLTGSEERHALDTLLGVLTDTQRSQRTLVPWDNTLANMPLSELRRVIQIAQKINPSHEFLIVEEEGLFRQTSTQTQIHLNLGAMETWLEDPASTRLVNWMNIPMDAKDVKNKRLLKRILFILIGSVNGQLKAIALEGFRKVSDVYRQLMKLKIYA